ncbi:hypothetical protein B0H13DRAFT_1907776 [Mycena leptocephala]|nr:hypothetical protein B0H13DRAFT_1907776 [Mycena leptocephala]
MSLAPNNLNIFAAQVGYDWNISDSDIWLPLKWFPRNNTSNWSWWRLVLSLIFQSNEFCGPAVLNTKIDGIDAYATRLAGTTPVKPGRIRDERELHGDPRFLYRIIRNHFEPRPPCLVLDNFGRGHFQAGVIVDPKPAFKFDPSDLANLAEFRDRICPTNRNLGANILSVIADYEDEIATLYETVEQTATLNIPSLVEWDAASTLDFVRNAVHNIMANDLGDDEDIFQHGCDSLQAIWIRNGLLGALRDLAQLDTRRVWFESTPSTVLLRSNQIYDRQAHALVERGLDAGILDSSKTSLLTGDVSRPGFGLATLMHQGVTHIIHTAWPVDFNLALRSFEPNIKGLRNLLDFSLDSPFMEPRANDNVFRESPVDAEMAVQNGYTESKWISEEILAQAAESTPAKPLIIRVGQLSGGINGAWTISEWVPALVQSAQFIKCIPDDSRDVTWLPVHIAAAAIIGFLETAPGTQILENVAQKQTQEDSKSFRALRLLPFFLSQNHQTAREAFGFPRLDAANATSASKSLRSPGCQLGEKDVKEWIGYWREAGFI